MRTKEEVKERLDILANFWHENPEDNDEGIDAWSDALYWVLNEKEEAKQSGL